MQGYCGICRQYRPIVEWNYLTYQFECANHTAVDRLGFPQVRAPKTEVVDSRASASDDGPKVGADWSEVSDLCEHLSGLLDVNDPRYEVENWRRAQEQLRAQDRRRLIHGPTCNITLALNNPGWMGGRNCDCKPEWK